MSLKYSLVRICSLKRGVNLSKTIVEQVSQARFNKYLSLFIQRISLVSFEIFWGF